MSHFRRMTDSSSKHATPDTRLHLGTQSHHGNLSQTTAVDLYNKQYLPCNHRPASLSHPNSLLQAAFKVEQHVVGLMEKTDTRNSGTDTEQGVVVPLSLACRAPQVWLVYFLSLLVSPTFMHVPRSILTLTPTPTGTWTARVILGAQLVKRTIVLLTGDFLGGLARRNCCSVL